MESSDFVPQRTISCFLLGKSHRRWGLIKIVHDFVLKINDHLFQLSKLVGGIS